MLAVLLLACASSAPPPSPPAPAVERPAAPAPPPAPPPPPPVELSLLAVGDVLPHRRVKATAADAGWSEVFGRVTAQVQGADLAFANLESPVAPDHHQGIHGEVFNAPASLVDGLADAGFDVLSMANNHAYDQGTGGLLETRERVQGAGMEPVGAGPDCATAWRPVVREVHGIEVAFLAVADLTNIDLNTTPEAACVAWAGPVCTGDCGPDRDAIHFALDTPRLVQVVADAAAASDLLVLSFHWGDEYRTTPLPEYPQLAHALTDAGVDILLGHHPHVLQPIEARRTARDTPALIAYSLGNFVSDMGSRFDPATHPVSKGHTRDGLALVVTVRFEEGQLASLSPREVPLWTTNNRATQGEGPPRVTVGPTEALDEPLRTQRTEAVRAVLHP